MKDKDKKIKEHKDKKIKDYKESSRHKESIRQERKSESRDK